MKHPNRAQWWVIWIVSVTAACTWLNLWPDFDKMLWNSRLFFPPVLVDYERRQFAIVIAILGLLLTWQLSHVNLGEVFERIRRRAARRRTSLIAIAALTLSSMLFLMLGGFLARAGAWLNLDLCVVPGTAVVSNAVGLSAIERSLPADVPGAGTLPSFAEFLKEHQRPEKNVVHRVGAPHPVQEFLEQQRGAAEAARGPNR